MRRCPFTARTVLFESYDMSPRTDSKSKYVQYVLVHTIPLCIVRKDWLVELTKVTGQLQDPVHIYVNTVENRRVDRFEIYSYVETY